MAIRIKARAIHRCGELLQQIQPAHGANQNIRDGTAPKVLTRVDAANAAGLSERQRKTSLRVARIPDDEFEEAVGRDEPATVAALANRGRLPPRTDHLRGRDPADFREGGALLDLLHHIVRASQEIDVPAA